MPRRRDRLLPFLFLLSALLPARHCPQAAALSSPWHTLAGAPPAVVARGGLSGIFPDSSQYAYDLAMQTSLPDVVLLCAVQLTKDGEGICLPEARLSNGTAVNKVYGDAPNKKDWLSVDLTLEQLSKVPLVQGIFSRTDRFDGMLPILSVQDLLKLKPPRVWLSAQDGSLFSQHNLSMKAYITSLSRASHIDYISSPEVSFLRSIAPALRKSRTKFILQYLYGDAVEPSTKQTYASLLQNFTFVKSFASGVLVPKDYIWPVNADLYLLPHTSVVSDAHSAGLEVFAYGFANDVVAAYNYSYDPVAEYLSFVDNGQFSVDGFLSDYPITASAAVDCFSHLNTSVSGDGPIVFSHNGASGVYPGCTDLAYQKAVEDGSDYIDCPVQVTKDGVLICLSSPDLMESTTVALSTFSTISSVVPQIQSGSGTFTFNLTWKEIQDNLKPSISSPLYQYKLTRNPLYKNAGKLMKLTEFLAFAKGSRLSGVVIKVENGAFLVEDLGIDVTESVLQALSVSGYNESANQKVMIQSSDSSVLKSFKKQAKYKLVYEIDELISDALPSSIQDIKLFANSVAINKKSIFPASEAFITQQTGLVQKLQSANLSVYVYLMMNEFPSQPWDFFSDPYMEINSYFQGASMDGIITDFPATATRYRRNTCLKGNKSPSYMLPVQPGGLLMLMAPSAMPPVLSPYPSLTTSDVEEPPLPPVLKPDSRNSEASAPRGSASNGQSYALVSKVAFAVCFISCLFLL